MFVRLPTGQTMAERSLESLWKDGKTGALCPWEQALAVAFRKASEDIHGGTPNMSWIASKVTKIGGGHPCRDAMRQFFDKVDADEAWYPGKHSGKKRGPAPLLTPAKRRCIAVAAMRTKAAGEEPTPPAVIARCPISTTNPQTKKPFDLKLIRKVLVTNCYDIDPDNPWRLLVQKQRRGNPSSV